MKEYEVIFVLHRTPVIVTAKDEYEAENAAYSALCEATGGNFNYDDVEITEIKGI